MNMFKLPSKGSDTGHAQVRSGGFQLFIRYSSIIIHRKGSMTWLHDPLKAKSCRVSIFAVSSLLMRERQPCEVAPAFNLTKFL